MDQNVSKKDVIDVSGEGQGRSLPQWFGQMFLGRKKNRSCQEDERYFSVDISDLGSSSDPLPHDDRHHHEFDLPSVNLADDSGENVEQASTSQSEAKKKQQKLLEEFALLSGIELSSQSAADLRDSVEKQLETDSLPSSPLALELAESVPFVDAIEPSKITEIAPVLEKQPTGRVHDAYTLLVENEKKQKIDQADYVESVEFSERQEEVSASSVIVEPDEPIIDVASEVESDVVAEEEGEDLTGKFVYDQEAMDSILSELNKINSIHSVVVVGADGSILACNNPDQLEENSFGALVFKSVNHFKRLGQQSGLGSLAQSVIEFAEGKLIVENLGDCALFIAVDRTAILGLVRNQTKNQIEKLKSILT